MVKVIQTLSYLIDAVLQKRRQKVNRAERETVSGLWGVEYLFDVFPQPRSILGSLTSHQIEASLSQVVTPRSRNTDLVAYSDFLIIFFDLHPVFILNYSLFIWSFSLNLVPRLGVNPSLTGDPILEYYSIWSFWYSDLTDFSLKHYFLIF